MLKIISAIIHIFRNIYKKSKNDPTREYAEANLKQHLVYFDTSLKLLEGDEPIKDEIIDVLIKILWSFCSIRKLL